MIAFTRAAQRVATVAAAATALTLALAGCAMTPSAPEASAPVLPGTTWSATALARDSGALAPLVPGSKITLAFGADGRASGSAGCNRYFASYQAESSKLSLKGGGSTRMMCGGDGVMAQEQAYLRALDTVATMRIEADRLELRTPDGAPVVAFTRERGE
jgi:heat shock protein HslJ